MIDDLNLNVEIEDIGYEESVDIDFFQNFSDIPYIKTFYIYPDKDNIIKVYSDKGKDLLIEANYDQAINVFDDFLVLVSPK